MNLIKNFLDKLPFTPENRSNIISPFGTQFEFFGREKAEEEIWKMSLKNLTAIYQPKGSTRKEFEHPAASGAPGIGKVKKLIICPSFLKEKTRLLKEFPRIVREKALENNFPLPENQVELFVSYENGSFPKEFDNKNPAAAFAWRMMHNYFGSTLDPHSFLEKVSNELGEIWKKLSIGKAIEIIGEKERKEKNLEKTFGSFFFL